MRPSFAAVCRRGQHPTSLMGNRVRRPVRCRDRSAGPPTAAARAGAWAVMLPVRVGAGRSSSIAAGPAAEGSCAPGERAFAGRAGCKRAVKSKSMTTEEVHLNPALEQAGVEVVETDFGEFIIQLAGERPSHLVAPAVHHTRESIARILSRHTGEALPDEPALLAKTGRRLLREKFAAADMGISGVNFAVAETG